MEKLFVYGTLQDEDVQQSLIGRTLRGTPDTLSGYAIHIDLMPPYPVAMPAENSAIKGYVLSVTSDELAKLDDYEGECYVRIRVSLLSDDETWVYIGNPACYSDDNI